MITQGEVNVGKAFGIKKIEKFFMEIVPNQHAKAYLVGMATDFGAYDPVSYTHLTLPTN